MESQWASPSDAYGDTSVIVSFAHMSGLDLLEQMRFLRCILCVPVARYGRLIP